MWGRSIFVFLAALVWLSAVARAGTLNTPYTDPAQFTRVRFGEHSHWAQPWRAYLETVPAATFLNGTGINFNLIGQDPDLVAKMLSRHGIRHARIEVGWGGVNYDDETKFNNPAPLRALLLACKKFDLRPLLLLNAHQGVPCPAIFFTRTVTAAAHRGDTTVELDDTGGLRIGYSGLSNLTDYWAAEALVLGINSRTVTLSKPLPKDIAAGSPVGMATLKYRPFGPPDSPETDATLAGWQRYVGTVARFAISVLGTENQRDKGFDMEIWNELTFGSQFLYVNHYYANPISPYNENSIWSRLVATTAAYADAHPTEFQGVAFGDGFANTIPWPSSSQEPLRITAIDKHPYTARRNYPKENYQGVTLNAQYQADSYVPAYTVLFPEFSATALQTEMIERETAPLTTDLNGVKRGRLARIVAGKPVPCATWITEVNMSPADDQPAITTARALALKAKIVARYFCFFLNKGVTQLDLFAATGGDQAFGIVQDNFLQNAAQPHAVYPADDTLVTSPALAVTGRIAKLMHVGLDPALTKTRPLTLTALSDTHDHVQFHGDGTPAHPDLFDRDVFAFLPYQVNARRFVIPYYVMTRDVMKDLPAEAFTLTINGIHAKGATIAAYDPIRDHAVPITNIIRRLNSLSLTLQAADYPYLLTIQEAASATPRKP